MFTAPLRRKNATRGLASRLPPGYLNRKLTATARFSSPVPVPVSLPGPLASVAMLRMCATRQMLDE